MLALLAEGLPTQVIAHRLGCSPRTVDKHLERTYRKLGVGDRVNALRIAQQWNLSGLPRRRLGLRERARHRRPVILRLRTSAYAGGRSLPRRPADARLRATPVSWGGCPGSGGDNDVHPAAGVRRADHPLAQARRPVVGQRRAYFAASFARPEAAGDGSLNAHDGQVWFSDPEDRTITLKTLFAPNPQTPEQPGTWDGPDNITVSPHGGLIVAEDGDGKNHLIGIGRRGDPTPWPATSTGMTASSADPPSAPTDASCSPTSSRPPTASPWRSPGRGVGVGSRPR